MEVNNQWKSNDINKYYIISLDKETNEWKFFREIVGHTVFWKDEPSRYGMTKSKAIEVLNIVKALENEETIPTENEETTPTEPETPTENEGESGTTPTEPSETGETTPTDSTEPSDAPTEPPEGDNDAPTDTEGETPTGENESGETPSESNTEPTVPTEPETPIDPEEPTEPSTPTEPTEEPQYKIITISSVTYNSEEVVVFDDADYHKLKTTLTYLDTTYPNTDIHVAVVIDDIGKSIFYFYLDEELTWFLELKTNIDYSLVNNITTLDDIKELL